MREQQFIDRHESEWLILEDYLIYKKANPIQRKALAEPIMTDEDFPIRYRRVCNQLALAQTRHFSEHLVARLNRVVVDSHHLLYKRRNVITSLSVSGSLSGCDTYWAISFALSVAPCS